MPTKKPQVKKNQLHAVTIDEGADTIEIESGILVDASFEERKLDELDGSEIVLENCNFQSATIGDFKVIDGLFVRCNFAGVRTDHVFLQRIEMTQCRIQGTEFQEANITDVAIRTSKCMGSSFRFGKIKNTLFADCDLTDVDFTGAELINVTFDNCTLTNALFFQSTLASVSVKSSTIENIRITRESIKNLTVNSGQALYLATLFGLVVED